MGGKKGAKRKRDIARSGREGSECNNDIDSGGPSNVEGTPRGTPKGSLIQSKLNQSNQTADIGEERMSTLD